MTTRCCAFRLNDLAPCKNSARPDSDVCHPHRNFYAKEEWLARFTDVTSPLLLTGLDYRRATLLGRIQHVIEYSLTSGKIVLDKKDVSKFSCPPIEQWTRPQQALSLVDTFTVMVRTGKVSPRWNSELTGFCIASFAKMYSWELRDMLPSVEARMNPFFTHPDCKPHHSLLMLLTFHRNFLNTKHSHVPERQHIPDLMTRQLAHECLGMNPILLTTLYSSDEWFEPYDTREKKTRDEILLSVKQILAQLLPQYRTNAKALIRGRMDILKRDLMEATWHPRRVQAWLDAGDFELLEMMLGVTN
jgi:hypothetical protein